jgi:hypothetical protein
MHAYLVLNPISIPNANNPELKFQGWIVVVRSIGTAPARKIPPTSEPTVVLVALFQLGIISLYFGGSFCVVLQTEQLIWVLTVCCGKSSHWFAGESRRIDPVYTCTRFLIVHTIVIVVDHCKRGERAN